MSEQVDADPRPVDELAPHLDLYDPAHGARLWEVVDYARSHCPVLKTDADDGYYVVTRYDDLRQVTEHPETYTSEEAGLRGTPIPMPPLTIDPPLQTEFRRALNPYLSRSFLSRYEPDITDIVRDRLESLVAQGHMEFMNDFAVPVTSANLARVILDDDNSERIQQAIRTATAISSEGSQQAFFDMAAIAEQFLRDRAKSGSTRDDVLSAIVNGTVQGRPLTMEEQIGATTILFTGGLDTTKAALGSIIRQVALHPELEARLRDPSWIKGDLDEFLRYESPIMFMARTVAQDTELDGCPLKAGDRVAIHFAAANRDPARFDDPDELRFDRQRNPHAAFGMGVHRCIGLHFARMQIEIAVRELLARVTNLRIPAGEPVEMATGVVQSPERLPLEFDALPG
jgi:cytochrome P450